MRDDILKLIIAPVPDEYTGTIPSDGLDLLDKTKGFGVIEVDGLGREDINVNLIALAGQDMSAYQSTRANPRQIDIAFDFLTSNARGRIRNALPWAVARRLFIVTEDGDYWIDVYAENMPLAVDRGKLGSTLTLIAPNPFFKSVERHSLAMQGLDWHLVENAGDAPAWLVWDFAKVGNPTTISPYTATDGTKKEVKWSATRLGIAIDPCIDVRNSMLADKDGSGSIRRFGLQGTFGGLYINFEPGSRRCTASDVIVEGGVNGLLDVGYVDTNPVPHYTEDNYLPSGELDPKAEEAFKNDSAMDTSVTTVSKVFAPVSSNSKWLFLPPGTSRVRDAYNKNTPTPHGTLYWYDTYSVI